MAFDSLSEKLQNVFKMCIRDRVAAWYDNENSYTTQMCRTIKYLETQI